MHATTITVALCYMQQACVKPVTSLLRPRNKAVTARSVAGLSQCCCRLVSQASCTGMF
jgi:hypothetical protein